MGIEMIPHFLRRLVVCASLLVCLDVAAETQGKATSEIVKNPDFEASSDTPENRKGNKYGVWKVIGKHEAASWSLNDAHPGTFELITSSDGAASKWWRWKQTQESWAVLPLMSSWW